MSVAGGERARGVTRASTLLRRPDYLRLLVARVASHAGDGLFMAAVLHVVVFLPERQSTVAGFAFATALALLPFTLLEPFAGVFADRWRRRRLLAGLSLLRTATAPLILVSGADGVLVYVAMLVVLSANRLFHATALAVTPRVLRRRDERGRPSPSQPDGGDDRLLFDANAVAAIATSLALFGMMVAGSRLLGAAGVTPVVLAACVVWLASAGVLRLVSSSLRPSRESLPSLGAALETVAGELADALHRIARAPAATAPILTVAVGQLLQVLVIAVSLVIVKEDMGSGIVTFSWLLGAGGLGVFAGYATVGAVRSWMSSPLLIGLGCVVAGVAVVPPLVDLSAAPLAAGAALLGLSYAWVRVPADTLTQQAVPDRYRGRVFTVMDVGFYASRVLGAVCAAVVVPVVGAWGALALAGVLALAWAPVTPFWLRRRQASEGSGVPLVPAEADPSTTLSSEEE